MKIKFVLNKKNQKERMKKNMLNNLKIKMGFVFLLVIIYLSNCLSQNSSFKQSSEYSDVLVGDWEICEYTYSEIEGDFLLNKTVKFAAFQKITFYSTGKGVLIKTTGDSLSFLYKLDGKRLNFKEKKVKNIDFFSSLREFNIEKYEKDDIQCLRLYNIKDKTEFYTLKGRRLSSRFKQRNSVDSLQLPVVLDMKP